MTSPGQLHLQPIPAAPLPRMPRSVVGVLHAGYWGLYLLLLAMLVIGTRMNTPVPRFLFTSKSGFLLIVPNVLAFYTQYFVLAPRLFPQRKFALLAIFSLLTAIGTSLFASLVLSVASGQLMVVLRTSVFNTAAFLAWLSVLALIHMTLALVIRGFISWYEDIAIKEQLTKRTSEVEAALLRAKLDPHFLFNTLNNIDVLITRDAESASRYVNQLSDILRFVLYEARSDRVPLNAELAYLEKYVALQRLRFANASLVSYSISGNTQGLSVAPMLMIPFVENAFKHVAGQREDSAIVIAVAVESTSLTFVCSNSYQKLPASSTRNNASSPPVAGGLGMEIMQQRLALLYPRRHSLAVSDSNQRYSVRMDLTLDLQRG